MTTTETRLTVEPLSGWTGAEIHGLDLTRELTADEIATVRQALLQWKVVFFRDQHLDQAEAAVAGPAHETIPAPMR